MNSRERFLTALNLQQPDKVPLFDFLFSPPLFEAVLGKKVKTYEAVDAVECALRLGLDGIWIPIGGYAGYTPQAVGKNSYKDEWGTTYVQSEASWPIDAPSAYPIANREDYKNWTAPNPDDKERVQPLLDALKYNKGRLAILAGVLGPFTAATMLMGLEEMSLGFYTDPELVTDLIQEGEKFSTKAGLHLLAAGADAIIISDDLGYANSLFASPEIMREYALPPIRRMVETFRSVGAKVILHCDGNLNKILDDVARLGISGLHPIERKADMNLKQIKQKYGKLICPIGNVNSSSTLPYGTKEEIEAEVKECLADAAQGGGYIIASDHSLSQGIPVENVFHMHEAVMKYRKYPIQL